MFLTTHYLDEADALSDRIVIIDHGRIVASDTPDNLKAAVAGDLVELEVASVEQVEHAPPQKLAALVGETDGVEVDGHQVRGRVPPGGRAVPGLLRDLDRTASSCRLHRGAPPDPRRRLPRPDGPLAPRGLSPTRLPKGPLMTFLRESSIVFRRQIRMNLRNPAWVLIGLMQPVLYLLLFGPLLKPLAAQFGYTNSYTFFVPGLLVQLGIFGAFFAGFWLIGEWRDGVIEAERVTPASRTALLMGRLWRDVLQLFVQALILVGLGYLIGMAAPLGGAVLGIALTLLLGAACAASSNALALTTKSEDVMAPVINMVMMPVLLLSGILLPMTLGPEWLQKVSNLMPTKHVVDAVRNSFLGDFTVSALGWGSRVDVHPARRLPVVGNRDVPARERLSGRTTGGSRRARCRGSGSGGRPG